MNDSSQNSTITSINTIQISHHFQAPRSMVACFKFNLITKMYLKSNNFAAKCKHSCTQKCSTLASTAEVGFKIGIRHGGRDVVVLSEEDENDRQNDSDSDGKERSQRAIYAGNN